MAIFRERHTEPKTPVDSGTCSYIRLFSFNISRAPINALSDLVTGKSLKVSGLIGLYATCIRETLQLKTN